MLTNCILDMIRFAISIGKMDRSIIVWKILQLEKPQRSLPSSSGADSKASSFSPSPSALGAARDAKEAKSDAKSTTRGPDPPSSKK